MGSMRFVRVNIKPDAAHARLNLSLIARIFYFTSGAGVAIRRVPQCAAVAELVDAQR